MRQLAKATGHSVSYLQDQLRKFGIEKEKGGLGIAPYGWDWTGTKLVPNAKEQEVLCEMRRARRGGRSYSEIAFDLNQKNETIVDPLGETTEIQNDSYGNPLTITYPDSSQATITYDAWYDATSQTNSVTGISTSAIYDNYGDVLSTTSGNNNTTTMTYGPTGLLATRTDPMNNTTSYTYNSAGQVLSQTDPLGHTTQYGYDSAGNLTSVTDALGHSTTMTYDGAGNRLSSKDADGNVTSYSYDAFNRILSTTTAKGENTRYLYSSAGQLTHVFDPAGGNTTYQYDVVGNMISKTDPLGNVWTSKFDANGNLIQDSDPNGNVRTYTYDALNRLTQKATPDNTITLGYDNRGRMNQANNFQAALSFNYDPSGRLLQVTSSGLNSLSSTPGATLAFTYDNDGNRLTMAGPTGSTSYNYDADDRLLSLTNPHGESYSFGFDAGNRLISVSRPGSSTQIGFNNANLVDTIVHSSTSATLASFTYQRDNAGQIVGVQTTSGSGINRTLAYDADQQLASATNPEAPQAPLQSETFSYDEISNRTQDEGGSYTYGTKSQRLVQDYRYTYVYDNNGNLSSRIEVGTGLGTDGFLGETTNYFYSADNQLIGIKVYPQGSSTPSKVITYAYNALGQRDLPPDS